MQGCHGNGNRTDRVGRQRYRYLVNEEATKPQLCSTCERDGIHKKERRRKLLPFNPAEQASQCPINLLFSKRQFRIGLLKPAKAHTQHVIYPYTSTPETPLLHPLPSPPSSTRPRRPHVKNIQRPRRRPRRHPAHLLTLAVYHDLLLPLLQRRQLRRVLARQTPAAELHQRAGAVAVLRLQIARHHARPRLPRLAAAAELALAYTDAAADERQAEGATCEACAAKASRRGTSTLSGRAGG
jgi:hypothetical protein